MRLHRVIYTSHKVASRIREVTTKNERPVLPASSAGRPDTLGGVSVSIAPTVPVVDRFLLDEPEVAELCGVSRNTVRDWCRRGLIVPVVLPHALDGDGNPKPKRRKLFRREEVLAFVTSLPSAVTS